jgi:hypothetical protein
VACSLSRRLADTALVLSAIRRATPCNPLAKWLRGSFEGALRTSTRNVERVQAFAPTVLQYSLAGIRAVSSRFLGTGLAMIPPD